MAPKPRLTVQMLVLLAALAGVYQLVTAAQAMNFYNNSSITLDVSLDCGFFCANEWLIDSGDMNSRPNKGGTITAIADYGVYSCNLDVDEHGWVEAAGTDQTNIVLTSYHQDGSVRTTCEFEEDPLRPF